MSEVLPRVTGTEMEYGVGVRHVDSTVFRQVSKNQAEKIVEKIPVLSQTTMLANGGRCYEDLNSVEYATGEDDSFMGTVANEIAGEQLVAEAVARFVENDSEVEAALLLKRAFHGPSVTGGYHINLCGDASTFTMSAKDLYDLGLWAATCSMYTGAGCAFDAGVNWPVRMAIAQKSTSVRSGFSTSTTHDKPLICIRNEPLSDASKYHRVQVAGVDPNISPWASWMALGTASLCLRSIEQYRRSDMRLKEQQMHEAARARPLSILARAVALNPDLDTVATLEDGSTISVLDIQWELYRRATETEHTDEEALVLQNWEQVLRSIEGDRLFLRRKVAWPVRHDSLRRYASKHGLSPDDRQLLVQDRKWDSIQRRSMADTLRGKLWSADMPPAELIADRRENPCPNTRAALRVDAIRDSINYKGSHVDWSGYRLGAQARVILRDPLMTTLPEPSPEDKQYYEPDDEEAVGWY